MASWLSHRGRPALFVITIAVGSGASAGSPGCNSPDGVLLPAVGAGGAGGGAAPLNADWSRAFTGNETNVPTALALDSDGSPILGAQCNGQVSFGGPTDSTPGGVYDVCVAKLDKDGTYKWSVLAGTPDVDYLAGVGAVVRDTIVYGYFDSAISFDPGVKLETADGRGAIFLVRLDELGKATWGKAFGVDNQNEESPAAMTVDKDGNIIIVGSFTMAFDLDGTALVPVGYEDMFIAKFSADGAKLWAKSFGAVGSYAIPHSVAADKDGRLIITGALTGSVDFVKGVVTSAGSDDILLASFDMDGDLLWGKAFGGVNVEIGQLVAVDSAANIYISGALGYGCVDFGAKPPVCGNGDDDLDVFTAKFTRNGDYLWGRAFGDKLPQYPGGIAVNAAEELFVTGFFRGSLDAGNGVTLGPVAEDTMSYPCYDMYLLKYDKDGSCVFSARYGDGDDDKGLGVAVGPDGKLIVTGVYSKTIDFGDGPLTESPPPKSLMFMTKLPL